MYITITDIMGEKRIDLTYPNRGKQVASMFSDNIQYQIGKTLKVLLITNEERWLPEGTFMGRELNVLIGRKVITMLLDDNDHVIEIDKLACIMEMVVSLDELDNAENLENGRLNNILLRYHVTANGEFMHFESNTPQYKKIKNEVFTSLTLKVMNQKNKIITDGPGMTIVLYIR